MSANSNESVRRKSRIFRYLTKAVVLALIGWFILTAAGRVLEPIALKQISELSEAKITAESVKLRPSGAVRIKKLSISPEGQAKYDDAIFRAEAVYVRFGWPSLLLLRPRVKEIRIKDFVFDAQYDFDSGSWNLAALNISGGKKSGRSIPRLELKKGTIRYSRVRGGRVETVMEIPLNAVLSTDRSSEKGYKFQIITAQNGHVRSSNFEGYWREGNIAFSGGISSSQEISLEKVWMVENVAGQINYDANNDYSLQARVKNLEYYTQRPAAETFVADKPMFSEKFGVIAYLQDFFDEYQPSGRINIEINMSGNLNKLNESKLEGTVHCRDVSVCNNEFPYEIKQISGKIGFTENSYTLEDMQGQHEDVRLFFGGWYRGFGEKRQYEFRITSENMALDDDLYNALSAGDKKQWSDFDPKGSAKIDYNMSRQSPTEKKKRLAVELLGAQAKCRYFPYPLKNLSGKLVFESGDIIIKDIVSRAEGCKITINGSVKNGGSEQPIYDVIVEANNMPLDSRLSNNLPVKQKHLFEQLNLGGTVDGEIKITNSMGSSAGSFTADVAVRRASVKTATAQNNCNASARPGDAEAIFNDISAKVMITPDLLQIENLKGRYGQGSISLTGQVWPGESVQQSRYHLMLYAEKAQLNNSLVSMLPHQLGQIICGLEPKGKVNVIANFDKETGKNKSEYKVTVSYTGDSINLDQLSCSIENIWGDLRITNDSITIEDMTGSTSNDPTRPAAIKINGRASLKKASLRTGENYIDFDGGVEFKNCDFGKITELTGVLMISGLYKTQTGLHKGEAKFSAQDVRIEGKSLTGLNTAVSYDPNQQSWVSRNLIANCYDGMLTGKFTLKPMSRSVEYLLETGFNNIDLKKFLQDRQSDTEQQENSNNNYSSGKMSGSLNIGGRIGESFPRLGRCRLVIKDMEVGKMSPLAKVLLVLKLTEPKDFAFEQMLVDSYIENKKLSLEKIDLSGESLAFNGSGWMDLDSRNVNVTLTARGRRLATAKPSMLQSLTDALGTAMVRIEVGGNYYDLTVKTTTLPVIKDSLGILGSK